MSVRLPSFVDERFLRHRLTSTSHAGVACATLAVLLCLFRYYRTGIVNMDLIAVAATFVVLKYALLFWYRRTD
jgi:hypothetical protein